MLIFSMDRVSDTYFQIFSFLKSNLQIKTHQGGRNNFGPNTSQNFMQNMFFGLLCMSYESLSNYNVDISTVKSIYFMGMLKTTTP